jgi:hypothetical protein
MSHLSRRVCLLVPVGLLLVAVVYGACTPGSEITAAESDVVATLYSSSFDFGSVKRYAMPDSIFRLVDEENGSDSDFLTREDEVRILAQIESSFEDRGYVKVDTNATPPPDFQVIVAAQAVDYWNLYTYNPWYGWWGYYWWYYPPATGVSYAYTIGSLFVQMGDFEERSPDDDATRTSYWWGAMNGVLNDTSSNREKRVTNGINQMFEQSPYLKTDL